MRFQKLFSVAGALTVASAITFTGSVSAFATDAIPVNHADRSTITTTPNNANARSAGTIHQISSSTALWRLSQGVSFDAKSLTVTQNGITEKLPTTATDKNGVPVRIIYQKNQSGIEIRTVLMYQDRDVWKCILGTGGGAILGGGSLGAAGVGVGTVFPGIGNVAGGVGGAIIGVIGGGMRGAAASCF
ncbi:hypothetical protein [Mobiluncus mulieris]|uniref:Glycine zipper family protein n=1 Tax=Mobiluncus mulieris TaxID=2052 RepID=A0ABD4TYU1_9ACTO|nr:hypothetical protein [Mobiluncus mulieris]MCU9969108.1 hypothetical protein [Mobiluncus mulieris]